jgi:hypothetical protein
MKKLSNADYELTTKLACCLDTMLTIKEDPRFNKQHVETMEQEILKLLDTVLHGLDRDIIEGVMTYVKNNEVLLRPRITVSQRNEFTLVDNKALEELLSNSVLECSLCDINSEKEAKKCRKRKLLIRSGLLGKDSGSNYGCEFK